MVTTELVTHPLSGEQIDLASAPDEHLARFLADIREYESRLREAKAVVSRETLRRMDFKASYTLRAGGYTLKAPSPAPGEEWDAVALREDLLSLVDHGIISIEAADAAVEQVIAWKVRKAGITGLRKLGGIVQETVDRHCHDIYKDRRVSVSRST